MAKLQHQMTPRLFLNIPQGHGDVLTFPHTVLPEYDNSFSVEAIGTHGCRTCVGVYIPLGGGKCFIAHMDAHLGVTMGRLNEPNMFKCDNGDVGEALKDEFKKKLALTLHNYTASLKDVELNSKAIVLCPRQNIEGHPSTGAYIVDAVCEFLGVDKADMKTQDAHGFVVNPASGVVQFLRWGVNGEARPTDQNFEDDDFEERFPEEEPSNHGWTELDHTDERDWTTLWSRGEWIWADPAKAIGPGF